MCFLFPLRGNIMEKQGRHVVSFIIPCVCPKSSVKSHSTHNKLDRNYVMVLSMLLLKIVSRWVYRMLETLLNIRKMNCRYFQINFNPRGSCLVKIVWRTRSLWYKLLYQMCKVISKYLNASTTYYKASSLSFAMILFTEFGEFCIYSIWPLQKR